MNFLGVSPISLTVGCDDFPHKQPTAQPEVASKHGILRWLPLPHHQQGLTLQHFMRGTQGCSRREVHLIMYPEPNLESWYIGGKKGRNA
jgi:hypothetical protein